MGKGDKKSRKGKISIGSYGVSRARRKKKSAIVSSEKKAKPVKAEAPKKVAPKKEAASKKETAPKKEAAPKKAAAKKTSITAEQFNRSKAS
jgi:30S ribosomal protein S31